MFWLQFAICAYALPVMRVLLFYLMVDVLVLQVRLMNSVHRLLEDRMLQQCYTVLEMSRPDSYKT
jgi:hypothetical protein